MSRRDRLRRKAEIQKQRDAEREASQQQQRDAAEASQDDMQQATVTRKGTIQCEELGGELKFTALSIAEQGEIKEEALRYYRKDQLKSKIDELKVMIESDLMTQDEFDDQLQAARDEVRVYSFDDMPRMPVEYERDGKKKKQNVEYERWFMAATKDGQITAVLVALHTHHPDITRSKLEAVMSKDPEFFIEAAEIIQDITNSLIAKKSRRRR